MATKNAAPRFKNVSPLGALDVPALGRVIAAGEEFEIREELVPLFAAQVENFEPVNTAAQAAQDEALTEGEASPSPVDATDAGAEPDGEPGGATDAGDEPDGETGGATDAGDEEEVTGK